MPHTTSGSLGLGTPHTVQPNYKYWGDCEAAGSLPSLFSCETRLPILIDLYSVHQITLMSGRDVEGRSCQECSAPRCALFVCREDSGGSRRLELPFQVQARPWLSTTSWAVKWLGGNEVCVLTCSWLRRSPHFLSLLLCYRSWEDLDHPSCSSPSPWSECQEGPSLPTRALHWGKQTLASQWVISPVSCSPSSSCAATAQSSVEGL